MSLNHGLYVFRSSVFLYAGIDNNAVFVYGNYRKAEYFLCNSKAAGLGGVQRGKLKLIAIGFGKRVNVRHKSFAGDAAVAEEID